MKPVPRSRDELRTAFPDVAEFLDGLRAVFGEGVRVQGIVTADFTIGKPDLTPGIRLTDCVWDRPVEPEAAPHPADVSARRRRRA